MNSIKTVIKFELIRYFLSPLAYVYLISFLVLSGSCAIYFGHFFVNGQANLFGLFDYQPWIYLLFIPAISMRTWAEEFRSKSIIQLLTTPVSLSALVWGKYFASLIFAIISILLTFPFWVTVNIFGNPDNTVIFTSYLSCFLLAAAMLAVSQTISSLTKSSVSALVLSVFVNLLFFWSGFEYVLFWARELFSDVFVDTIMSFSFLNRFSSLSRGLIELRDVIFFLSLIIFFNLLTIAAISFKTKGSTGLFSSSCSNHRFLVIVLLFIGFFGLNIIANNLLRQISYDFTEEKYLSLTKNTKDILRKLDRPVTARLYYSPILGKRNPNTQILFDQLKLLLKQYKSYSKGKFDYRIYTPNFLDKIEDRAIADGIQPIPLIDINQNALFGIVFSDNLINKSVIPFFSVARQPFLEQDFTTAIYKLDHKKKTIGILSTLPVMGNTYHDSVFIDKWEIINKIEEIYKIKVIEKPSDIDESLDALMLIHPHHLSPEFIEKIKQQKNILLLLDVADDASRLYSPQNGTFLSSDLRDLEDFWHFKFYKHTVAADFDNSITVDDTINYKKNPSFTQDLLQFKLTSRDFNPNHRITYKLNSLFFSSASMVMSTDSKSVFFFPLIKTSNNSSLLPASYAKENKAPREILDAFSPQNESIILAAQILSNNPSVPFNIIAVADTDFIYDTFWAKEMHFLDSKYFVPSFDSANFILNSLDYLTDNDDLISLRGKTIKSRSLYKIDEMRKNNVYRYKLKENDIFNALDGVRAQLTEVTAKRNFEERETFNADELALIGKIRNEMSALRQKLSDLRLSANQNISAIELKVKFYNIYFISLIILLLHLILFIKCKNLSSFSLKDLMILDKNLVRLFIYVLLISVIAGITVFLENRSNLSLYEDVPVFKEFSKEINHITKIKLENKNQTLTFSKKDGVWYLDEFPALPVYQERLRHLLIEINNMTFLEKKSDRVEDMKYFGFSPLQDSSSPMTQISLFDKNENIVEKFDIGWSDIDVGRGSRASYIRLNNQFQIWLATVDFYDLSLDKSQWTYDSLWNLRFGRLYGYNNKTESFAVMEMAKKLLNSHLLTAQDNIEARELGKIRLFVENNNELDLTFYKTKTENIFVKYSFLKEPNGHHLEFFADYVKDKYFEISQHDWELLHNDILSK